MPSSRKMPACCTSTISATSSPCGSSEAARTLASKVTVRFTS